MKTKFKYTVAGKKYSETILVYSTFVYNKNVERILNIADKDSVTATTV